MTERAPKLTLIYFRFSASAETLRLAAAIGKIPFTNKAIDYDEWELPADKKTDPRYQLPVLEIEVKGREKQFISQRNAILHYLGRRGGLYPADSLEGLQVEYMLDTVSEALRPLEISDKGAVTSLLSDDPWTEDELLRIRERIAHNTESGLPLYLSFFEHSLLENYENSESKWLVGSDVSIADLQLYHLVCWISGGIGDGDGPSLLKGIESSLIDKYPLLLRHKLQVETLPEVLAWRAKYSPPYSVFEYRPPFEFRSLGRRSRLEAHQPPTHHPAHGRLNPTITGNAVRGKWMATIPRLTLTYFDKSARAEPIRLAAALGQIPFTNRAVNQEDWEDMKIFCPLRQLPTLAVVQPGKELVSAPHSTAILRYIGKLGGLYPLDEIDAVHVEFMIETIVEAQKMVEMTVTGVVKSLILDALWSEDQILQIQKRVLDNQECGLPLYLNFFERLLSEKKEQGWLVGKEITVADLLLYHLVAWLDGGLDGGVVGGELRGIDSSILDSYPLLRKHREAVDKLPPAVAFREQFSSPYTTFEFVPKQLGVGDSNNHESDNRPKRVKRMPSADGLPKNVARSKSSDSVPRATATRHFGAPSPVQRRPSRDETDDDLAEIKKSDHFISAPVGQKASFDYVASRDNNDPRRRTRGGSMPARPRPVIIDDDDDDINFSDDTDDGHDLNDSSTSLLNESATSLLGGDTFPSSPVRRRREDFFDDSSTTSFDDESSFSSVEHDLENLKKRLQSTLAKEKNLASASRPVSSTKKDEKKKKPKRKKSKKTSSKSTKIAPKLPVNTPRNIPPKKKVGTKKKKDDEMAVASVPVEVESEAKAKSESIICPVADKQDQAKTESTEPLAVNDEVHTESSNASHTNNIGETSPESRTEGNPKSDNEVQPEKNEGAPKTPEEAKAKPLKSYKHSSPLPSIDGPPVRRSSKHHKRESTPKMRKRLSKFPSDSSRAPRPRGKFPVNKPRCPTRVASKVKPLAEDTDNEPLSAETTSQKKRLTIMYFSIPGRAEQLRMAAVIGHIPFTNLAIDPADRGGTYKHLAPLDQLPVLEIEEAHNRKLVVPQSNAILRYFGMLGGLYPEDPVEAAVVDSMCDSIGDTLKLVEMTVHCSSRSILEFKSFSDEECVAIRQRLAESDEHGIRKHLSFIEKSLERNFSRFGGLIAHSYVTIADLRLHQLSSWLSGTFGACLNSDSDQLEGIPTDILQKYPLLQLHQERIEEIPQVEVFRAEHKYPYANFDFRPDIEVDLMYDYKLQIPETSKLPRLTLTHMNASRSAEPLRLAAVVGKLPFTNKVIESESQEWKNIYERRVDVDQFPLLEIESPGIEKMFVISTLAILRYFGRLGGLYPCDPIQALEVDSMIDTIDEIKTLLEISSNETLQMLISGSVWSENERWSVRRRIAKSKDRGLPFYLSYFEKAIKENISPWLVGNNLTIADLYLHSYLCAVMTGTEKEDSGELNDAGEDVALDGVPDNLLVDFPVLTNHKKQIDELPAVVSFRSKFHPPYKTFTFRPK